MAKLGTRHPVRQRDRGMSLIEILVGVVIGMIGIVVIFQVLAVSEGRKRTTIQGSDAQSAGAIGLYSLQRDVQLGGYGFGGADSRQLGCTVTANRAGTVADFRLIPVEIVQGENLPAPGMGALGAPDMIRVLWGNANQFVTTRSWTGGTAMKRSMTGGRGGLSYGDLVVLTTDPALVVPPATTGCTLIHVTDRPAGPPGDTNEIGNNTTYEVGATLGYKAFPTPIFNQAPPVFGPPHVSGFVFNLGTQPRRVAWTINGNRLLATEDRFGTSTPLPTAPPIAVEAADGIVNLQAEYGCDANNNQLIAANEWTAPTTAPGDLADWRCMRAIRVALLARSTQWDPNFCAQSRPQWTSGTDAAGAPAPALALRDFVMTNIDGTPGAAAGACPATADPNDWRRYRYSVYETVIPLRNMIWGTAP